MMDKKKNNQEQDVVQLEAKEMEKKISGNAVLVASPSEETEYERIPDQYSDTDSEAMTEDAGTTKIGDGEPISDEDLDNVAGGFLFFFF